MTLSYLQEVSPGRYRPVATRSGATHRHVRTARGIQVAPLSTDAGGIIEVVMGDKLRILGEL
ncbi:hypothetical protein [Longimicrobium sp.]|uniref:hypothetical protein n=1 Tax=Longimicrobium sp. TaxID=2029185 RepID=UPI002ED8C0CF